MTLRAEAGPMSLAVAGGRTRSNCGRRGRDPRRGRKKGSPPGRETLTGHWDWDGTLGLGRDTGTGTGHWDWDGTLGLGRDTGTGTGHRDWDGTPGLGRDTFSIGKSSEFCRAAREARD